MNANTPALIDLNTPLTFEADWNNHMYVTYGRDNNLWDVKCLKGFKVTAVALSVVDGNEPLYCHNDSETWMLSFQCGETLTCLAVV